jgi:hypothetical protein
MSQLATELDELTRDGIASGATPSEAAAPEAAASEAAASEAAASEETTLEATTSEVTSSETSTTTDLYQYQIPHYRLRYGARAIPILSTSYFREYWYIIITISYSHGAKLHLVAGSSVETLFQCLSNESKLVSLSENELNKILTSCIEISSGDIVS